MRRLKMFLPVLAVVLTVPAAAQESDNAVKEAYYGKNVPVWQMKGEVTNMDMQKVLYPKNFSWDKVTVSETDGKEEVKSQSGSENKRDEYNTLAGKLQANKDLKALKAVGFPGVYDVYLFDNGGKFGMAYKDGKLTAKPEYDKIYAVYQKVPQIDDYALLPVFMVSRNKEYALVDLFGSVLTRFCKDPEMLKDACLISESDHFNLKQIIPDKYWK